MKVNLKMEEFVVMVYNIIQMVNFKLVNGLMKRRMVMVFNNYQIRIHNLKLNLLMESLKDLEYNMKIIKDIL